MTVFRKWSVIAIIILLIAYPLNAQNINKDSLWSVWTDESQPDTIRLEAMMDFAWDGYLYSQPDSAYYFAQLHYDFAKRKGLKKQMGGAYNLMGVYFARRGDFDSALVYHSRNLAIGEELGDKRTMAIALNNMAIVLESQGLVDKAIEYFIRSLKANEEIGNKGTAPLHNIADIHFEQGDYDKALEFSFRCLSIEEEFGNSVAMTFSLFTIGDVYSMQGDTVNAMAYFSRSLALSETIDYKRGIAGAVVRIGEIYLNQGDFIKAKENLFRALRIEEEIESQQGIIGSLNSVGVMYRELGDYQKAIEYSSRSLSGAQEVGVMLETMDAAKNLYEAYSATGRFKKAFEMLQLYMATKDSVENEKNLKEVIRQGYRYDYEKQSLSDSIAFQQQKELDALTHEAQLDKAANQRDALLTILGLLLLLIAIGFRGFRRKQKINALLERKNEEKTAMMKEIHHRVKNNLQVVNSLLRLQSYEIEDQKVVDMFEESQHRVLSMALLHEKMYRSDDIKHINIHDHFTLLIQDLVKSYAVGKEIKLDIEVGDVDIGIKTLVPLGLIINEIITNALKYAFEGRKGGSLKVHLNQLEDNKFELIIGDDGVGMDKAAGDDKSSTFGLELIQIFTKQLDGKMEQLDVPGMQFRFEFSKIDMMD